MAAGVRVYGLLSLECWSLQGFMLQSCNVLQPSRRLGPGEPPLHAGELLGGIEWQGTVGFGAFRQIPKP